MGGDLITREPAGGRGLRSSNGKRSRFFGSGADPVWSRSKPDNVTLTAGARQQSSMTYGSRKCRLRSVHGRVIPASTRRR
jgi:hypothetical protein